MLIPYVRRLVNRLTRQVARPSSSVKRYRDSSFRLLLEVLEDRTVLSTVNWIGGSGT